MRTRWHIYRSGSGRRDGASFPEHAARYNIIEYRVIYMYRVFSIMCMRILQLYYTYIITHILCSIAPFTSYTHTLTNISQVLAAMQSRQDTNNINSKLSVSYVEIFGDQIYDLLKGGAKCGHSKVAAQR